MANLKSNNFDFLKLRLNKSDYWDYYIFHDHFGYGFRDYNSFDKECLISYIDISNKFCVSGDTWLVSTDDYQWENALSIDKTFTNISYTGIDNGLFTFRKDRITNTEYNYLFQHNTFDIFQDDVRLKLHAVSGNTLQYEYPLHINDKEVTLNGGFFQGFFKTDCKTYNILPSRFESGDVWQFEFVLKPMDLEKESDKTLNDKYPNNKGIFFYLGTRAENKWIYYYDKDDKEGIDESQEYPDDYVEDGGFEKKEHIIGNFYNVNPDWDYKNWFDDYTTNKYYNPSLYAYNGDDDYTDAIDFSELEPNLKLIDESIKHKDVHIGCIIHRTEEEMEDNNCVLETSWHVNHRAQNKVHDGYHDFLFGLDYLDGLDEIDDANIDYLEDEINIEDFVYKTDNGFNLNIPNQYKIMTDNKFLLFDHTPDGFTVYTYKEGDMLQYMGIKNHFTGNLFLLMNHTPTGYTVNNIQQLIDTYNQDYDVYADIYDNALAFRYKDDGSIGYRILTKDCEIEGANKTKIIENYSFPNVVKKDEFSTINVRMHCNNKEMQFMFYVNGKLVYITEWLPKIRLRELNELPEKQEGVPFNLSLGGGTQGLSETLLNNYMLNPGRHYPLEKNFAGSFIGQIKSFKFYDCYKEYESILGNYIYEKHYNY